MSIAAIDPRRLQPGRPSLDDETAAFDAIRSRLIGIAHRILGRWSDAEDIVQEAWIRWQLYDRTTVANPTAFLVTTTTRLALNVAQLARLRHEACAGARLPDLRPAADDPSLDAERRVALEQAVMALFECLAPRERTAYVLHEAFDVPYPLIAAILGTSEANARQLGSRAAKHLVSGRCHAARCRDHRQLVSAVVGATRRADLDDLTHLLNADSPPLRPDVAPELRVTA
jgi:RNA polymerase sigma-70 factor, ECF subfamily